MRVIANGEVPRCVAYSPDGNVLLAAGAGGVRQYALPSCEPLEGGVIDFDDKGAEVVAFLYDGVFLAVATVEELFVFNVLKRLRIGRGPGHANGTRTLAWSPDGRELATAGWDSALNWRVPNLSLLRSVPTPEPVTSLAYHPGGELLAGGGARRSLLFWRREEANRWVPSPPVDVGQSVYSLATSRDGRTLAAGHHDGRISLWDFESQRQVGELTGHEWVIYGMAFTPDGTRLVSGGADRSVRLWDVPHRRPIETYRFHASWVTCVAVSPDGMTAAVGGNDEKLVVWDLADV